MVRLAVMNLAIETENLTKIFEPPQGWRRVAKPRVTTAVENVSLAVAEGEVFGLLGPNGAGKTTLTKLLCTLIIPTSGSARVMGHDLGQDRAIRQAVGLVVTDERSFHWRLTGEQNLRFFAALHGLHGKPAEARLREVLAAVEMGEQSHLRFSSYSSGMKQRLAIARALLHRPRLLFLDEPSRSLDPIATQKLHQLICQLVTQQGVTIFLITHDLAEAEALSQKVAVMHKGQIQVVGSPWALRQQLGRQFDYRVQVGHVSEGVLEMLQGKMPALTLSTTSNQTSLLFTASETDSTLNTLLDILHQHQIPIYAIEGQPPTLEEVFAHFTREK